MSTLESDGPDFVSVYDFQLQRKLAYLTQRSSNQKRSKQAQAERDTNSCDQAECYNWNTYTPIRGPSLPTRSQVINY